jgi:hypothetical protein
LTKHTPSDVSSKDYVFGSECPPALERDEIETFDPSSLRTAFNLMRFRLTYGGPLPPHGEKTHLDAKWEIRRQLHFQLAELYRVHPVLTEASNLMVWTHGKVGPAQEAVRKSVEVLERKFIPLVRPELAMACRLDITYLRRGEPGRLILEKGDLDNRLKTLFDGLRKPTQSDMHKAVDVGAPMHVLLDDDKLVTGVAIDTDRLLMEPKPDEVPDLSLIIMDVTVRITHVLADNTIFTAD